MTNGAATTAGLILGLMVATVLLVGVGERFDLPYPVLMVLLGAVLALVPWVPSLKVNPKLILPVFLPPLIFAAAQRTSWRSLWERRGPIVWLAGVLVLATVAAVAVTARAVVPGVTVAAAIALGALTAPPDPVAAEAVAGPLGLPRRLLALLQAEGLCNDATALVVYGLAVQYIDGTRSAAWTIVPKFCYEAAGGVALGLALAWLSRRLLRVISSASARSALTLVLPFACYLLSDAAGASGVLAVLSAALYLGRSGEDDAGVLDRLSGGAFWNTVELLITGIGFGLIGLELSEVVGAGTPILATIPAALAICAVLIGLRFTWMLVSGPLVRRISPRDRRVSSRDWRDEVVLSWCGMRGLATIALALALPSRTPDRGQLLLITFAVIAVTLVAPGLTLPALVSRLGVRADTDRHEAQVLAMTRRAAKASMGRFRELDSADDLPSEVGDVLRRRQHTLIAQLGGDQHGDEERLSERRRQIEQIDSVYAQMLAAARAEVLRARTEPGADPAAADEVLRELDLRSVRLI